MQGPVERFSSSRDGSVSCSKVEILAHKITIDLKDDHSFLVGFDRN
ncbi:unnamed protein product [[Actinomadura] parvosata subsp. kistnae]|nr:unnamed protein product [Actinomadura parvosata subsp. kistnae]